MYECDNKWFEQPMHADIGILSGVVQLLRIAYENSARSLTALSDGKYHRKYDLLNFTDGSACHLKLRLYCTCDTRSALEIMLCPTCRSAFSDWAPLIAPSPEIESLTKIVKFCSKKAWEESASGCFICCDLWERPGMSVLEIERTDYAFTYNFICTDDTENMYRLDVILRQKITDGGTWRTYAYGDNQVQVIQDKEIHKWRGTQVTMEPFQASEPWVLEPALSCVRAWLQDCTAHHELCKPKDAIPKPVYFPRRLVDIGEIEGYPRLIDTREELPLGPYATLSHRWPSDERGYMKLTKRNMSSFMSRLDINGMSRTFQDSLVCARRLGIRYIWIDSLCIIQDSEEDWHAESATMADIYSCSYCNICATADECVADGLFHPRRLMRRSHEQLVSDNISFVLFDHNFWSPRIDNQNLYSRGWVFQEHQLSSRTLHFGPDQLLWECNQHLACERYPQGFPQRRMTWGRFRGIFPTATMIKATLLGVPAFHLPEQKGWAKSVVEKYSHLKLTKANDRLVAIGGVARAFQRRFRGQYLAGLWRDTILSDLQWHVEDHEIDSARDARRQYIAPTWSWASPNMPVEYGDCSDGHHLVEFVDGTVTPVAKDPLGAINDGHLLLRGSLCSASFAIVSGVPIYLNERNPTCLIVEEERRTGYTMHLDREDKEDCRDDDPLSKDLDSLSMHYPDIHFLPLSGMVSSLGSWLSRGWGSNKIGLLLEPVEGRQGVYRRLGLCHGGSGLATAVDIDGLNFQDRIVMSRVRPEKVTEGKRAMNQLYLDGEDHMLKLI